MPVNGKHRNHDSRGRHGLYWWVNGMYRRMGMHSDEQPAGRLTLREVPDGTWSARWIDTVEARPWGQETVTSENGILVLRTPPTAKSVVARLQRQAPRR